MIKQKVLSFVAAVALTLGMIAPVATVPAQAQTAKDASIIINFCKIAHRRFMQGDKGAYLNNGMSQLTEPNRPVVALACAAYGVGFDTGARSLV